MTGGNRLLVGQIALELSFVTREQLQECIDFQAGQPQPKPIGALLVENGFLTPEKLAAVLEERERRLHESLPHSPTERGAVAFGHLVVQGGHATAEAVNQALRAQQDLAERGQRRRLGELLVDAGHLKAEIVPVLLKQQGKTLMACTFCGSHYNVLTSICDGYPCLKCGMPMSETLGTISAIETAYLLPRMDSRSRTDLPSPAPALEAAASPVPAPLLDPGLQRELLFRIIQVVAIIGAIGLGLYLLSR
jgi:hypothetical protein